jgi:diadenosine tetraphosphate (Ap4A) HIT family hydrolase
MAHCELCESPGGDIVWQDALCRVVAVGGDEGAAFPGFCRVVWRRHVAEMTDLPATERRHLMNTVFAAETAVRALSGADKINLASLGNTVPHLHWHVIPRWREDSHFPAAVWATPRRPMVARAAPAVKALHDAIVTALAEEATG